YTAETKKDEKQALQAEKKIFKSSYFGWFGRQLRCPRKNKGRFDYSWYSLATFQHIKQGANLLLSYSLRAKMVISFNIRDNPH
ncbi:MAG: hypothetical protein KAS94_00765, partial [Desulfobulbaceae bacterium]|nr:hypothetical protein [Desulfobulbaceae bacterium]